MKAPAEPRAGVGDHGWETHTEHTRSLSLSGNVDAGDHTPSLAPWQFKFPQESSNPFRPAQWS